MNIAGRSSVRSRRPCSRNGSCRGAQARPAPVRSRGRSCARVAARSSIRLSPRSPARRVPSTGTWPAGSCEARILRGRIWNGRRGLPPIFRCESSRGRRGRPELCWLGTRRRQERRYSRRRCRRRAPRCPAQGAVVAAAWAEAFGACLAAWGWPGEMPPGSRPVSGGDGGSGNSSWSWHRSPPSRRISTRHRRSTNCVASPRRRSRRRAESRRYSCSTPTKIRESISTVSGSPD